MAAELYEENKLVVLGLLMVPLLGVAAALVLLVRRGMPNPAATLGIILFATCQYLVTVYLFIGRIKRSKTQQPGDDGEKA